MHRTEGTALYKEVIVGLISAQSKALKGALVAEWSTVQLLREKLIEKQKTPGLASAILKKELGFIR